MSLTLLQLHIDHSSLLPLLPYNLSIQERNLAAPIGQTLLHCSIPLCVYSGFKTVKFEPGAGQFRSKSTQEKVLFFVRSLIIVILNTQENTSLLFTDHFKDIINLINILKNEQFP